MIKHIIFDMDGVLIDSEDLTTKMCIEVLKSHGINADYIDFKNFTGMGDDIFIGGVCEMHGAIYNPKYKEEFYDMYAERSNGLVYIFPWTKIILKKLSEIGITYAVASASDLRRVKANIACIGVPFESFSAVVTGTDVKNKKPSPDIFLKAAEKANFNPKETIVCEDAVSGTIAAKNAGMTCVSVTTSFSKEQLKNAGADYVVDDLSDLLNILK